MVERDLHDLVWVQCSLVCSRLYLCMPAVPAAQCSEAQAEVMKYAAMFKSKLFMFIPQVSQTIVDHHSLSWAVPRSTLALTTTENLKCWTVKNGARSYNKAMSSEMPSQRSTQSEAELCVDTQTRTTPSTVVAHKDSKTSPTPTHPQPHQP